MPKEKVILLGLRRAFFATEQNEARTKDDAITITNETDYLMHTPVRRIS